MAPVFGAQGLDYRVLFSVTAHPKQDALVAATPSTALLAFAAFGSPPERVNVWQARLASRVIFVHPASGQTSC